MMSHDEELPPLDPQYLDQVVKRFDEVLEQSQRAPVVVKDPAEVKIVVFSDHHKGARDGADDFAKCEQAYCAALGYYLERGFQLLILGDSEELWEEAPKTVIEKYRNVFDLESQFLDGGGLVRFYGNHDSDWAKKGSFQREVPGMARAEMKEGLLLQFDDGKGLQGRLLFAHGHQGTSESEKNAFWSRIFVREVWRRIQRKFKFSATQTPSSDLRLRGAHDRAMFEWAQSQDGEYPLALVTGHTHRPVFSTPRRAARDEEQVQSEYDAADKAGRPDLRAELEAIRVETADLSRAYVEVDPPCYFNTGCCSFPDGDITGLEIEGGKICLVRWPDDEGKPRRKPLANPKALRDVFEEIRKLDPGKGTIREVLPT